MKIVPMLAAITMVATYARAQADETALVAGSSATVGVSRSNSTLLLDARQAAKAFGWQAKLEQSGKLLVICQEGDSGVCIPLRLGDLKTEQLAGRLFVEAGALAKALGFRIVEAEGQVALEASGTPAFDDDLPAYNAAWGEGRGLRIGQRLPDIPLYDLEGREVRFSRFLGKQYIIYCWASW